MGKLVSVVLMLVCGIAYGFLRAWWWVVIFNLFPAHEFGMAPITFRQAYAASMVIGLILNWRTLHKDMTLAEAWKVGFRLMLSEQFGLALTLLVCWLITR